MFRAILAIIIGSLLTLTTQSALACGYHYKVVNNTNSDLSFKRFHSKKDDSRAGSTYVTVDFTVKAGTSHTETVTLPHRKSNTDLYVWLWGNSLNTGGLVLEQGSPSNQSCYDSFRLMEAGTPVTFTFN